MRKDLSPEARMKWAEKLNAGIEGATPMQQTLSAAATDFRPAGLPREPAQTMASNTFGAFEDGERDPVAEEMAKAERVRAAAFRHKDATLRIGRFLKSAISRRRWAREAAAAAVTSGRAETTRAKCLREVQLQVTQGAIVRTHTGADDWCPCCRRWLSVQNSLEMGTETMKLNEIGTLMTKLESERAAEQERNGTTPLYAELNGKWDLLQFEFLAKQNSNRLLFETVQKKLLDQHRAEPAHVAREAGWGDFVRQWNGFWALPMAETKVLLQKWSDYQQRMAHLERKDDVPEEYRDARPKRKLKPAELDQRVLHGNLVDAANTVAWNAFVAVTQSNEPFSADLAQAVGVACAKLDTAVKKAGTWWVGVCAERYVDPEAAASSPGPGGGAGFGGSASPAGGGGLDEDEDEQDEMERIMMEMDQADYQFDEDKFNREESGASGKGEWTAVGGGARKKKRGGGAAPASKQAAPPPPKPFKMKRGFASRDASKYPQQKARPAARPVPAAAAAARVPQPQAGRAPRREGPNQAARRPPQAAAAAKGAPQQQQAPKPRPPKATGSKGDRRRRKEKAVGGGGGGNK